MPDEGLGVVIPVLDPHLDRFGELAEAPPDQVEPRCLGRREVEREPGVEGQPLGDVLMLMR